MSNITNVVSVSELWSNWLKKSESDIIPITICDSETTVVFELEGEEYRLSKTQEGAGWFLEATNCSAMAENDEKVNTFV